MILIDKIYHYVLLLDKGYAFFQKLRSSFQYNQNDRILEGLGNIYSIVIEDIDPAKYTYNYCENGKIVFSNGEELNVNDNFSFRIPRLMNYVPDEEYKDFIKGMKNTI